MCFVKLLGITPIKVHYTAHVKSPKSVDFKFIKKEIILGGLDVKEGLGHPDGEGLPLAAKDLSPTSTRN